MKNTVSMEKLFIQLGYKYQDMKINEPIDVSNQNIRIKSFDHKTNKVEYNKILKIVRKEDSSVLNVMHNNKFLFKGTLNHRVYNAFNNEYISLKEASEKLLLNKGNTPSFRLDLFSSKKVVLKNCEVLLENDTLNPIIDLEVEDNSNYFSNGVLSHNTTPGGNALKYYASQRVDMRRISVVKDGTNSIASQTKVKVIKNKVGPPFKEAIVNIVYGTGIDFDLEVVSLALEKNVLTKKGAWYSYKDQSNIAQGEQQMKVYLQNNPDLKQEIIVQIL